MAISGVSSVGGGSSSGADQDVRVLQLKSQIEDWSTCPTTDPKTKKAIVGKLEAQLDMVKASIQTSQQTKQAESDHQSKQSVSDLQAATGLGSALDISA